MGVRGNTTRINFERGVTGTMGERACAREGEDKGRSDPHGRGAGGGTTVHDARQHVGAAYPSRRLRLEART